MVNKYKNITIESNYLKVIYTEPTVSQTLLCISVSKTRYCTCGFRVCLRGLFLDPENGGSTFFRNIPNFYQIAGSQMTGDSTLQPDISDLLND